MDRLGGNVKGDLSSLTLASAVRFGREALSRISSEARFADQDFQFRIFPVDGRWCIEGNPNATNLTTVNRVVLRGGARILKTGDVIGLIGRRSGRTAMRLQFQVNVSKGFHTPSLIVGLSPDEAELQNALVEGWKSFSTEIDITNFVRRTNWSSERIYACVQGALYNHPEIFYFTRKISLGQWSRRDGSLVKIALNDIQYDFPASEYGARKHELAAAVLDALSRVRGVADEVEKMLRLHDYLVSVCDYDLAAAKTKDHSCLARTAYSALVRHKAVCEGYAMAYRLLLNAAGIVSDVAVSIKDCHVWNYVRTRGNWYHVDVTYDDPVYVGGARQNAIISHKHFLMSDAKAALTGHHAWNVRGLPPAIDKRYDAMYH